MDQRLEYVPKKENSNKMSRLLAEAALDEEGEAFPHYPQKN
jgi:hypothetical protein